ncbi:YHS domain-containing protein [Saccharomonospora piscinae]|uniref:YHS domain-containing protein n=1 Tax=Saccharomonospora piscinae TaxID=687388 RepID=UPI001105B372|nr:YHS domain-containing protein [Saccharomonospora piscinae]TLW90646.1 YHS domain-containing protein [Saccharomonospora piscinae]
MMLVEVHTRAGVLTAGQRAEINRRFIQSTTGDDGEGHAPETLREARRWMRLVFHEAADSFVDEERESGDVPPRFLVRVSVPGAWRKDTAGHLIKEMTRALAEVACGDRAFEQPDVWVHVLGVPEGGIGVFGTPMGAEDLVRLLTRAHRESPRRPERMPEGSGYDPVCGMVVPLRHAAAVAEHDGETYAFCSKGCHHVFTEDTVSAD